MTFTKWDSPKTKKYKPTFTNCGTLWEYAVGKQLDDENNVMGYVVGFAPPKTFTSTGTDYALGAGFLFDDFTPEWEVASNPSAHQLSVTIEKKEKMVWKAFIQDDIIYGDSKQVEKFYPIFEPGSYRITLKNNATGVCAPGKDKWLNYSQTSVFTKVSGYSEPTTTSPPTQPSADEKAFDLDPKLAFGVTAAAVALFFVLS